MKISVSTEGASVIINGVEGFTKGEFARIGMYDHPSTGDKMIRIIPDREAGIFFEDAMKNVQIYSYNSAAQEGLMYDGVNYYANNWIFFYYILNRALNVDYSAGGGADMTETNGLITTSNNLLQSCEAELLKITGNTNNISNKLDTTNTWLQAVDTKVGSLDTKATTTNNYLRDIYQLMSQYPEVEISTIQIEGQRKYQQFDGINIPVNRQYETVLDNGSILIACGKQSYRGDLSTLTVVEDQGNTLTNISSFMDQAPAFYEFITRKLAEGLTL